MVDAMTVGSAAPDIMTEGGTDANSDRSTPRDMRVANKGMSRKVTNSAVSTILRRSASASDTGTIAVLSSIFAAATAPCEQQQSRGAMSFGRRRLETASLRSHAYIQSRAVIPG